MRWVVIGNQGLFGSEMVNFISAKGLQAGSFNRTDLELDALPETLAQKIGGADVIVNAVGYTDVDRAEIETYETNMVNGIYAGLLAQAAKIVGARFIHISTDYIFDGSSTLSYRVSDQINPQTAYGKSKALGEQLVSESGADYAILRTAWLYGANGRCFPKAMAELLKKNGCVRVVNDQIGQPTWTRDLAEMVLQVIQLEDMPRIVHATASGQTSWAGFAKEVAESIGMSADSVVEISTEEFPTAAQRPAWSVLDNSSDVLTPIGDWRERWRVAAQEVLRGI